MTEFKIDETRLKLLMQRAGIESYTELAEKSGIHRNTLHNVIRGEAWKSDTAAKLADVLGCNPIDMLVADGYPDPNWEALAVPLI